MHPDENWYLLRTKPGKERPVYERLVQKLPEVFLPMLKGRAPRWGRMVISTTPLFPCYLFAKFSLSASYYDVRYLPGMYGIVSAGADPIAIPERMIHEIRLRSVDDVIEIPEKALDSGEPVRIVDGPFRGFDALFERYLSGTERVSILLNAVETAGVRVVLPARAVFRSS